MITARAEEEEEEEERCGVLLGALLCGVGSGQWGVERGEWGVGREVGESEKASSDMNIFSRVAPVVMVVLTATVIHQSVIFSPVSDILLVCSSVGCDGIKQKDLYCIAFSSYA